MIRSVLIIFFFFFIGCSFTKTSFWTQDEKIQVEKKNISKIFKEEIIIEKEINQDLIIKLDPLKYSNQKIDGLTNNLSIINTEIQLAKRSKFRFSKHCG